MTIGRRDEVQKSEENGGHEQAEPNAVRAADSLGGRCLNDAAKEGLLALTRPRRR